MFFFIFLQWKVFVIHWNKSRNKQRNAVMKKVSKKLRNFAQKNPDKNCINCPKFLKAKANWNDQKFYSFAEFSNWY